VYPETRATQLAKQNKHHVLSMPDSMSKHLTAPSDSAQSPNVVALQKSEVSGVDKSGKPVRVEEVVQSSPKSEKP
jgi:hypothetical protein